MKPLVKTAKNLVTRNASDLLLVGGIGCLIGGSLLGIKQTPKAIKILDENKEKTKVEKIKKVAPLYVPTVVLTCIGIAQIVCSRNITKNKIAAITTAYTVSETAFKTYRNKVKEIVEPEISKVIEDQVAEETVKRNPIGNREVVMTPNANVLILDSVSGRYFTGNVNDIENVVISLNKKMMSEMYMQLNDLYSEIGLPPIKIGCNLGWHIDDDTIKIRFGSTIADNGDPCLVLDYDVIPIN